MLPDRWRLLLPDVDRRIRDDIVEDRGIAEVDEGVDGLFFGEELAEFFAVARAVKFIGGDEGEGALVFEEVVGLLVEVDEEVGGA